MNIERFKPHYSINSRHGLPGALFILLSCAVLPGSALAGSYLFASESSPDSLTHPPGLTLNGGVVHVEVCIAKTTADAALIEIPAANIAKEINFFQTASPNLIFGGANDVPGGTVDFESLTLHELGHCIGLAHPNLGVQPGVESENTDFTISTDGANNVFDINILEPPEDVDSTAEGGDSVIGSADDQRGDDVNLNWFEVDVNNPFLTLNNPTAANYSRDLADLPNADDYVSNAGRAVGSLLGVSNTEAVMQQGQFFDEDQRRLQADDVTALRYAMLGLDGLPNTGDDYTIRMVYGGIATDTSDCDIVIESNTTGFGSCSVGGFTYGGFPNNVVISGATYRYNQNFNTWHFNQTPLAGCSAGENNTSLGNITDNQRVFYEACNSVTLEGLYSIGQTGDVTVVAPVVSLEPGVSISGEFKVINIVP